MIFTSVWRHAERLEISDDCLVKRALGRQGPAGKHGNLEMGISLGARPGDCEMFRRMLDQPQHLVVFRGMERLDDGGVNGVEKSSAPACDPTLSHFGQNIRHIDLPCDIFAGSGSFRGTTAETSRDCRRLSSSGTKAKS
jgi:hypothetical protein